jgi:hypothetical protein
VPRNAAFYPFAISPLRAPACQGDRGRSSVRARRLDESRSALAAANTEVALLIESTELGEQLGALAPEELL